MSEKFHGMNIIDSKPLGFVDNLVAIGKKITGQAKASGLSEDLKTILYNSKAYSVKPIEDYDLYSDFYEGGKDLVDPGKRNRVLKQKHNERQEDWEQRYKERARVISFCHTVIDKIAAHMSSAVRIIEIPDDDGHKQIEEVMAEQNSLANYNDAMSSRNLYSSLNGTDLVGPYWDKVRKHLRYRTFDIRTANPLINVENNDDLEAIVFENANSQQYGYTHIWTDREYYKIDYSKDGKGALVNEDNINKLGHIPWFKFTAKPSGKRTKWYGISDIRRILPINELCIDILNTISEGFEYASFPILFIKGALPNDEFIVGPRHAIKVDEDGDVKYVYPDLPTGDYLDTLVELMRVALELDSIPVAAIQGSKQAKSGLSLSIELLPLDLLVSQRLDDFIDEEVLMYKSAYILWELFGAEEAGKERIFTGEYLTDEKQYLTPEEFYTIVRKMKITMRYIPKSISIDKKEAAEIDAIENNIGVRDPEDLIRKRYEHLPPKERESKVKKIKKEVYDPRVEIMLKTHQAGATNEKGMGAGNAQGLSNTTTEQ